MPRRPGDIARVLEQKFGFEEDATRDPDHRCFVLRLDGLPPIRTKVSHSRDPARDKLQGKISRQLRVKVPFYNGMMDCSNSREDYYQRVREEPYPPWDVLVIG